MQIKFIWDFYGEPASMTAKHHAIHLEEYARKHGIEASTGAQDLEENHSIAFISCADGYLEQIKKDLRPRRAEKLS